MKNERRGGGGKGGARRRAQRVIADAWRCLVARPGLPSTIGGEQIIDKMWINAEGRVIPHGRFRTHQEVALEHLRERGRFESTGDPNQDRLKAENILLGEGWVRCQVYLQDGLGLNGSEEAIRSRGFRALEVLPRPRRLYVMTWPRNEVRFYAAEARAGRWGTRGVLGIHPERLMPPPSSSETGGNRGGVNRVKSFRKFAGGV